MPSVQRSEFRSREKGVLCPFSHIQNSISIFRFFFLWRMWHICISLFVLIRICWLKVNEIESSWWHWIHLLLCLNTLHTANSLITCLSHTFISTNSGTPFSFRWLTVIRCLPPTCTHCHWSNSAQECSLNYPSNTSLLFFSSGEHFCKWCQLMSVWNALLFLLSCCSSPAGSQS